MDISIVGLGKLGSPMAACFAAKGHKVVGVDLNEHFVQSVNEGKAPVFEPGLQDMIDRSEGRLSATLDLQAAVAETDITFVIVPTPSLPEGDFSTEYVLRAAQQIGEAIAGKDSYHVVVLTSTVMPGATGDEMKPALEKASGKICSQDFGLCYSPEFISLGSVIQNYLHPDFVLIGESDSKAGDRLSEVYRSVCENDPPIQRMAFSNAELTKIAVNTFVTTKISYANMLSQMCEQLEDGDVDVVTSAIGQDSRIGRKYLKGATGFGGPCFPRDNRAIIRLAEQMSVEASLPVATDAINTLQVSRLRELTLSHLPPGGKVGVLGLAYKPDTNVVEKSQGLMLAQELAEEGRGISVLAYDPHANENAAAVLPSSVEIAASAAAVAQNVDVLVITIPCPEFQSVCIDDVARQDHSVTVIDCWRILPHQDFQGACNYVRMGTGDTRQFSDVIPFNTGESRYKATA